MPSATRHRQGHNIVTLDQEGHGLVAVVNGAPPRGIAVTPSGIAELLSLLPAGGGRVVADANVWGVQTELSVSQYCWASEVARDEFLEALDGLGYQALQVSNALAGTLGPRYGHTDKAHDVVALHQYVHDLTAVAPDPGATGLLACGCAGHHRPFDSAHPVRPARGDASFGLREVVARDFLREQNRYEWRSLFTRTVVDLVWYALVDPERPLVAHEDGGALEPLSAAERAECLKLFDFANTKPSCKSPNKLMAVACATHDPSTGALRRHPGSGAPLGIGFLTHRLLGLNGTLRGPGRTGAGSPPRAVLRALGRRIGPKRDVPKKQSAEEKAVDRCLCERTGEYVLAGLHLTTIRAGSVVPCNPAERRALDRYVRVLVRVLQSHGDIVLPALAEAAPPDDDSGTGGTAVSGSVGLPLAA